MLSGRLALVTGGGRGIGRAVSQVMSREGARVIAADLDGDAAGETVKVSLPPVPSPFSSLRDLHRATRLTFSA